MDSIQINTGEIRLSVNGDESRVIAFNPQDALFAEKFYQAIGEFEAKFAEYQRRAQDLEAEQQESADGIPSNMAARLALLRETCQFMRDKIDNVFGEGTSKAAFGEAMNLEMFSQFFDGVTPYFQKARSDRVNQYIPQSQKPARGTGRKRK